MIDNLKPYGAFVENTIRPLLGELRTLLDEFKAAGIHVNETKLKEFMWAAFRVQSKHLVFQTITQITVTLIICITVYLIHK